MTRMRTTTIASVMIMVLATALVTGGVPRPAAAELLRKTLPPGSNIDVKPRAGGVGNPRLVAKNETPLGFAFTVTNRWAWDGKEA